MPTKAKGKQPVRAASPEAQWMPKRETASNIDITEGLRSMIIEDASTPRESSPTTVKAPTRYPKQQPPRRKSGTPESPERPKLRRKAATAPPGSLSLFSTKPHPPRRAISARAPRPVPGTGIRARPSSHRGPLLPRISLFGTPASRSLISRRKSSRKPVGRLGLKSKSHVWRMLPPTLKKYEMMSDILENRKSISFIDRTRVKETLKVKNPEMLKTNIVDFKERDLPDTPGSVVDTPRELYRSPDELPKVGSSLQVKNKKKLALRPTSSHRAKHFSLPLSPVIQEREKLVHCRTGSMRQSPKQNLHKRNFYVPGPIRLADTSATVSRRASVATIDPFLGEVETISRRLSDIAALDEIFMYFHGFGIMEEAGENGIDKFWVPKVKEMVQVVEVSRPLPSPSAKALRRLGLDAAPHSPRSPGVTGRPPVPSLPSASPSATLFPGHQRIFRQEDRQVPPASPSPRQRVGLRRLLGSATSIL